MAASNVKIHSSALKSNFSSESIQREKSEDQMKEVSLRQEDSIENVRVNKFANDDTKSSLPELKLSTANLKDQSDIVNIEQSLVKLMPIPSGRSSSVN